MDAKTFLDNFATIAEAPGGVRRLRDLILDLAVQGELVANDPDDGTGRTIIERGAPAISKAVDEGWSRRRAAPEPAAEEIPFQIPTNWVWARLSMVTHGLGQLKPSRDFTYLDISAVNGQDGTLRGTPVILAPDEAPSRARKAVRPGTILYSTIRPYLRNVVVLDRDFEPAAIASTAFAVLHPVPGLNPRFLKLCLRSTYFNRFVSSRQKGVAYPAISEGELALGLAPIPPTIEQERIVAKVDELMGLCDHLEARQEHRHRSTTRFRTSALHALTEAETPEALRYAWDRADMSWVELLDSVEAIKSLRRAVLELATTGQFNVGSADQWTRCAFGEQITLQRGFDITKSQQCPGPYPVVSSGGVFSHHSKAACDGPGVVIGRKGSVGRVHWVPEDYWPHDTTLWVKDFHGNDAEYVYWFLRSFPLLDYESSTANPSLNRNRLHPVEVIWPAKALQAELVSRITGIFALCDRAETAVALQDEMASACAAALTQV